MTNEQVKQNVTPETAVEEIAPETTVEETPVVETAPETTVEETQTAETTTEPVKACIETGTVFNCARLNIRKEPKMGAEVLTIVKAGTKLKVDTDNSTDEWYQVTTKDNKVAGFCMKEYVKLP